MTDDPRAGGPTPDAPPTLFQLLAKVGRALLISIIVTAALFGILRFVCGVHI